MKIIVDRVGVLLLALMLTCSWAMAQATGADERALTVYSQGKLLYDAGDFNAARTKFEEAIIIEPANPRWHYNLGLTNRQLNNFPAAQQSLLKSLALDPNYKRPEIEQKLAAMGFRPDGSAAAAPAGDAGLSFFETFALVLGAGGAIWLLVRLVRIKTGGRVGSASASPNAALIAKAIARMDTASNQLVQVEHALRLGEHADLRSQLDHATNLERSVRKQIELMRQGNAKALRRIGLALDDLERSARRAHDMALAVFGAQAFAAHGDRVACYFCAKPLANVDYRQTLAMKRADAVLKVITCPDCSALAAQGRAPLVLTGADGRTHWSELPGFDPYAARHAANAQTARTPGWKFAQHRPFDEMALLAGGAALTGGAVAAMLSPDALAAGALLDLDAARENGLAQEAAHASAKQAAEQGRDSFSDHS